METIQIQGRDVELKTENDSFKFKCQQCGSCCKGSSLIINPYDLIILSKKFNMPLKDFKAKYTKQVIDKNNNIPKLLLKTKQGCIFLKENKCSIYNERPAACRFYPLGLYKQNNEFYYFVGGSHICIKEGEREILVKDYINQELGEELVQINKTWLDFETLLINSKAPLKSQRFILAYTKIMYEFDNPHVKEKIEKTIGKLSEDPREKFNQIIKFAKEWLLKSYI